MLEKETGNYEVGKLRELFPLEVDFNALHKINFNCRLIPSLEDSSSISQEIIGGRRSQAATHLVLSKKLISDMQTLGNYQLLLHVPMLLIATTE